ncbi:hypothetical protein O77CONTIG1_03878 [Leptolyngbya sp. O-77]|nr:hypothetical protein O77CONTIG1_03878 [Leptolyngbya sp. O-77]
MAVIRIAKGYSRRIKLYLKILFASEVYDFRTSWPDGLLDWLAVCLCTVCP